MVKAVAALIDFCYLVRRNVIDKTTLTKITNALKRFHKHHEIFREVGIRPDGFSLPRQHSLIHYPYLIMQFGAPNGLCSSITESKHIKAVKRPYRRSSRNKPLGQMLVTNQRIDKLAAAQVDFSERGMLDGSSLTGTLLEVALSRFSDNPIPSPPDPISPLNSGPPQAAVLGNQDNDLNDLGALDDVVEEPESLSEITLSKTHGMFVTYAK